MDGRTPEPASHERCWSGFVAIAQDDHDLPKPERLTALLPALAHGAADIPAYPSSPRRCPIRASEQSLGSVWRSIPGLRGGRQPNYL
jgi:hypothetical protein